MFKVIVAGSREFNNYTLLKAKLDTILSKVDDEIEIVSGCCSGADLLGERYAKEKGYRVKKFPANWDLGKKAGPIRNEQMAKYSNACVCFHNGVSRGTANMIKNAKDYNLLLRVVRY